MEIFVAWKEVPLLGVSDVGLKDVLEWFLLEA